MRFFYVYTIVATAVIAWQGVELHKARAEAQPTICKTVGEVCRRWHDATILWQWRSEEGPDGPVQQFPTLVCDEWGSYQREGKR